jgi:hypothetical protein
MGLMDQWADLGISLLFNRVIRTSEAAAHGPGIVTAVVRRERIMSGERIGVEWGFKKVHARRPLC